MTSNLIDSCVTIIKNLPGAFLNNLRRFFNLKEVLNISSETNINCFYDISIESPLLFKILNDYGDFPDNSFDSYYDEYGVSYLYIIEETFYFSFEEGYVGINQPIKTLENFLETFLYVFELDDPSEELEPFVQAGEEISKRLDEIKKDIIEVTCKYTFEQYDPEGDNTLGIIERMSEEDSKKYSKKIEDRIYPFHFTTTYSYKNGEEKFDYSYKFNY